jgi:hypothetical protein
MVMLAAAGFGALAVLAAFAFLIRRYWPRAIDAHRRRRARRLASKAWAERAMFKAIQRRDYPATLRAVDEWASRPPVTDSARITPVYRALTGVGRSIYGQTERKPQSGEWRAVDEAVKRALTVPTSKSGNPLPPLNPGTVRVQF